MKKLSAKPVGVAPRLPIRHDARPCRRCVARVAGASPAGRLYLGARRLRVGRAEFEVKFVERTRCALFFSWGVKAWRVSRDTLEVRRCSHSSLSEVTGFYLT